MKQLCILIFLFFASVAIGQPSLPCLICEKPYSDPKIASTVAPSLYGASDSFFEGTCNWQCNAHVVSTCALSSALNDNRIRSFALVSNPIGEKVVFETYLLRHTDKEIKSGDTASYVEPSDVFLRGFVLANGNRRSREEYLDYARIKRVNVYIDNQLIGSTSVFDTPKAQYVDFNVSYPLSSTKRRTVKLEITEVFKGKKYQELAISELQLDGLGGHSMVEKLCYKR